MNPFKMTVFLIVFLVGKIVSGKVAVGGVFLPFCSWEELTESMGFAFSEEFDSAKRKEEDRTRIRLFEKMDI